MVTCLLWGVPAYLWLVENIGLGQSPIWPGGHSSVLAGMVHFDCLQVISVPWGVGLGSCVWMFYTISLAYTCLVMVILG